MGLFGSILGNHQESLSFWNTIETKDDLQSAIEESFQKEVVIFKHSTRCPISRMVLKNFEKEVHQSNKEAAYFYLDLLKHRDISNAIEDELAVVHQSPQILIIKEGKVIRNASHQSIDISLV